MAKTFKQFQENWEFLSPASYDKKLLNAAQTPVVVDDSSDWDDLNFSAGKDMNKDHSEDKPTTVKGNPEFPEVAKTNFKDEDVKKDKSLRTGTGLLNTVSEDASDVESIYVEEVESLLEEIADLFESLAFAGFQSSDQACTIAGALRNLRDQVLVAIPRVEDQSYDIDQPVETAGYSESQLQELDKKTLKSYVKKANKSIDKELKKGDPKNKVFNRNAGVERAQDRINEDYKPGVALELHDGSKVKLSEKDATLLNKMFEGANEGKKSLEKTMMKNIKEFKSVLDYAKALHESIGVVHDDHASKKKVTKDQTQDDDVWESADVKSNTEINSGETEADAKKEFAKGKAAKQPSDADLQEVSKGTLGSYIKKAQDKQRGKTLDAVMHNGKGPSFNPELRDEANRKYHQTDKFIGKATDKIVKEDEEINYESLASLSEEDLTLVFETYSNDQLNEIINENLEESYGDAIVRGAIRGGVIGGAAGAAVTAAGGAVIHGGVAAGAGGNAIAGAVGGAIHGAKHGAYHGAVAGAKVGAVAGAVAHTAKLVAHGIKHVAKKVMGSRTQ